MMKKLFASLLLIVGVAIAILSAIEMDKVYPDGTHKKDEEKKQTLKGEKSALRIEKKIALVKEVSNVVKEDVSEDEKEKNLLPEKPKKIEKKCAPSFTVIFQKEMSFKRSIESSVKNIANWVAQHPGKKVVIEGHSDGIGSEIYNLKLSHQRAKKVARKLMKFGLKPEQIIIQAFGEYQPDANLGENSQRRVVVKIQGETRCLGEK